MLLKKEDDSAESMNGGQDLSTFRWRRICAWVVVKRYRMSFELPLVFPVGRPRDPFTHFFSAFTPNPEIPLNPFSSLPLHSSKERKEGSSKALSLIKLNKFDIFHSNRQPAGNEAPFSSRSIAKLMPSQTKVSGFLWDGETFLHYQLPNCRAVAIHHPTRSEIPAHKDSKDRPFSSC
ncbi:hypothetical protein CDAR_192641 [Caerostris darwini]|uniref:Uncharacterized protein n=1 Tax=Caerostris darwini TaxID=1538125 RepID=A0AAV4QJH7_9ARAC|nr:hypothetical protein CDAR_192641 [Caerostris darwini]